MFKTREYRTITTNRVHTCRSGWKISSDTKTIQQSENGDKKVIYHDNGGKFTALFYHLHYRPIEKKFDNLDAALEWCLD